MQEYSQMHLIVNFECNSCYNSVLKFMLEICERFLLPVPLFPNKAGCSHFGILLSDLPQTLGKDKTIRLIETVPRLHSCVIVSIQGIN